MIAVAGPRLPVIYSEWAGDRQHAGHHQGGLDPGGDAPEGSQVHAPRVAKAPPTGVTRAWRAWPADRLHGGG